MTQDTQKRQTEKNYIRQTKNRQKDKTKYLRHKRTNR